MKRKLLCGLFALLMLFSISGTAFAADSNVTYEGNAHRFIFAPGSEYSPTDLFPNFKDVMPGDSITQKLTIRNPVKYNKKIKLYMRSLGAAAGSEEFLNQLKLRVQKAGDTVMFDAAADQTAQLTEWVYLGTLYSGGEVDLSIILDVPVTLDNKYQNQVGYLYWQFKVEELEVSPDDPEPPKTYDPVRPELVVAILCGSAAVLMLLLLWGQKKREKESV